ncbi:HD family phosphohydrolase [Oxynema sp. CENA135]|uniref:HD family phosphohydrolase n=1 Tax=Oxynema sp. CENA135 TaxID=984206 RepID=UPI00190A4FDD|nr:HD family phosphohydrolase [Oxynema sp. CENA135]MBK4728734.1 HD family phosphohydrolase [Oxynema sp. CENA135]
MKSIDSLTRQLEQWRRGLSANARHALSSLRGREAGSNREGSTLERGTIAPDPSLTSAPESPLWKQRMGRRLNRTGHSPLSMVLAVACLTAVFGHRFYNQPQLDVGTVAPQTFVAPEDARVEDTQTTQKNREAARSGATAILTIDRPVNQQIEKVLDGVLARGDRLRELSGGFPFLDPEILSPTVQQYLREAQAWELRAVLAAAAEGQPLDNLPPAVGSAIAPSPEPVPTQTPGASEPPRAVWAVERGLLTPQGQQAVAEVQQYRENNSPEAFSALVEAISDARQTYATAIGALVTDSNSSLHGIYDPSLFQLDDRTWEATKESIKIALRRMLAQGIPPGLPKNLLQNAVAMQVKSVVPQKAEPLATDLLLAVVQPNLKEDRERTQKHAERAAQEVKPVFVTVNQGDVIVREGEVISHAQFILLDRFDLSRREIDGSGLAGFGLAVSVAVAVFWLVERRSQPKLRRRDRVLVLLLSLTAPSLILLGIPFTSLSAIGLLLGSFYGSRLGATTVTLLSILLPIGTAIPLTHLIASGAGGVVGAIAAGRLRSREELALLGGFVGLTQGLVYPIVTLILTASTGPVGYAILGEAGLQALSGVAWSIVALGLSPYLEHVFDLITPIRLAELANPNRPLLKRLAAEAPGTFQHTMFVATLAEAAAKELGCNVELVRTGTLYHDIGKMHDALGFIENQMGGPNKHDEINDPWISAEIIKKHVTEGLVMARKCRLPKAIQAFIPEHQGTMAIAYFYHQAKQRAEQQGLPPVGEQAFRYDGPIPQSRETGIVMLADSCEAALRSLDEATPEQALNMVNKILKARWNDDQLVDSGLTREEMPKIAEIFVRVWQQYNHKRIAYPKAAIASGKRT